MRLLYTSTDMAFSNLVRLTFDREEIAYFCSDADASMAGLATPMGGQARFYITEESDWDRAVALMREMGAPAEKLVRSPVVGRKHRAWTTIGTGALVIVLLWWVVAG